MRALIAIDYHLSIPITPEEFAQVERREEWRAEKNMIVLKLWSDRHRRTPIDVFVYEPFPFAPELASAKYETVFENITAPVVSYDTLPLMKAAAGRPRDLLDIEALRKLDPYR